jgi:hypothetical protein
VNARGLKVEKIKIILFINSLTKKYNKKGKFSSKRNLQVKKMHPVIQNKSVLENKSEGLFYLHKIPAHWIKVMQRGIKGCEAGIPSVLMF